jgi:hypothetical protein
MMSIQTPIDVLFDFIKENSPVKESIIPKKLQKLDPYENYIRLLETNGMIEIKIPLFSNERTFIFKSHKRITKLDPWSLRSFNF